MLSEFFSVRLVVGLASDTRSLHSKTQSHVCLSQKTAEKLRNRVDEERELERQLDIVQRRLNSALLSPQLRHELEQMYERLKLEISELGKARGKS